MKAERSSNLSPPSPDTTLTRLESVRLHLRSVFTVIQLIRLACNGGIKKRKEKKSRCQLPLVASPCKPLTASPPDATATLIPLSPLPASTLWTKLLLVQNEGRCPGFIWRSPMESRRRLMCRVLFKVDRRRCELAYRSRAAATLVVAVGTRCKNTGGRGWCRSRAVDNS